MEAVSCRGEDIILDSPLLYPLDRPLPHGYRFSRSDSRRSVLPYGCRVVIQLLSAKIEAVEKALELLEWPTDAVTISKMLESRRPEPS